MLPYGSFVGKLYTPNGDLDIALEGCVRSGCARVVVRFRV